MKYFTANINGSEKNIGSAAAARRFLRANPSVLTVTRWWWSGQDLIECEEYDREQVLNTKSVVLEQGATAQWAYDHRLI